MKGFHDFYIPPDDSVRTPEEIAAGTNHSSEYPTEAEHVNWLARCEAEARALALQQESRRDPPTELDVVTERVADAESAIIDLARQFAALRAREVARGAA